MYEFQVRKKEKLWFPMSNDEIKLEISLKHNH